MLSFSKWTYERTQWIIENLKSVLCSAVQEQFDTLPDNLKLYSVQHLYFRVTKHIKQIMNPMQSQPQDPGNNLWPRDFLGGFFRNRKLQRESIGSIILLPCKALQAVVTVLVPAQDTELHFPCGKFTGYPAFRYFPAPVRNFLISYSTMILIYLMVRNRCEEQSLLFDLI